MARSGWQGEPTGWTSHRRKPPVFRPWERPDWSAPEVGLHRDRAGRAVARLSPDYAAELPLWGQDWEALRLNASLLTALADWQQQFDHH